MCVYMCMCVWMLHVARCLQRPEEDVESLGTRRSWVVKCGFWKVNSLTLEEKQAISGAGACSHWCWCRRKRLAQKLYLLLGMLHLKQASWHLRHMKSNLPSIPWVKGAIKQFPFCPRVSCVFLLQQGEYCSELLVLSSGAENKYGAGDWSPSGVGGAWWVTYTLWCHLLLCLISTLLHLPFLTYS